MTLIIDHKTSNHDGEVDPFGGALKRPDDTVPTSSRKPHALPEPRPSACGELSPEAALEKLHTAQGEHPFWQNRLFKACNAGTLTRDDFKFIFSQYYLYSKNFTRYLAAVMAHCDSDLQRAALAENLWEEGGGLAPEQRHAEIFRRFLSNGLGIDVNSIDFLDSTRFFVREYFDFCLHSHAAAGSAFLSLGTEGIVPRMYAIFLGGLQKVGLAEPHTTFFRLHVECDDAHAETLEKMMLSYAATPDWYDTCRRSMNYALAIRKRFFEQLYEQIEIRRIRPVIDNIQNGVSLVPKRPKSGELHYRMGSDAAPLYDNRNERLNIDFSVERVPFKADVFDTRVLRIAPHKNNEKHKHPHESIFYVIEGMGRVQVNECSVDIQPGDVVFVPRWAMHQSFNTGDDELLILALTDFSLTERAFLGDHLKTTRMKGAQASR